MVRVHDNWAGSGGPRGRRPRPRPARAICAAASGMTKLLLSDDSSVRHARCFEFDPETGAYSRLDLGAHGTDRTGCSGVGQVLHSPSEGKVLVAMFLWSGDAWFSIGAEKWRLFDESLVLSHADTAFRCELAIHRGGKCIRTFRYRRRDWLAMMIDPAYDYLDFELAHLPVRFLRSERDSPRSQREAFMNWLAPGPASRRAASATIRLTRDSRGWDRGRYPVIINGLEHGRIGRGEVFECRIPPGRTSVRLGYLYRPGSNTLEFQTDEDSSTHLACGSNLKGWSAFRVLGKRGSTDEWLWLKVSAPRTVDVAEGEARRGVD